MEKLRRYSVVQNWMRDLAKKHDITVDTVFEVYRSLTQSGKHLGTLRQRIESFFDLYFEGVKEGN